MDLNLLSIIAFYTIIAVLLIKNWKKFDRQYGIIFLYRTNWGIKLIDKIASIKRFWYYWGRVAIPVGFIGMIAIFYLLADSLYALFAAPGVSEGGVQLIIPGYNFPFWYTIIALLVVIVVHEGAHGVISRAQGLKIKSTGVGLMGPIPLAFVEPDENQTARRPLMDRLAIFAAGPFANFCTAAIFFVLTIFFLAPMAQGVTQNEGIEIVSVTEGFPADQAGIEKGDIITGINGETFTEITEFIEVMDTTNPGDTVQYQIGDEVIGVESIASPANASLAHVGIQFRQNMDLTESASRYGSLPWIWVYLSQLAYWILGLNIGIGLINLLPVSLLDGGQMARAVIEKRIKKKQLAANIFKAVSLLALFLLIANIAGPMLI